MLHTRRSTAGKEIARQRRVPGQLNPIIFSDGLSPPKVAPRSIQGAWGVAGIGVFVGAARPKNITSELPPVFETQMLPLASMVSA